MDLKRLVDEPNQHSSQFNILHSLFDMTNQEIQRVDMSTDIGWNTVRKSFNHLADVMSRNIGAQGMIAGQCIEDQDYESSNSATAFSLIFIEINAALNVMYPTETQLDVTYRINFMLNILKQIGINLTNLKAYKFSAKYTAKDIYKIIKERPIRLRLDHIIDYLGSIDVQPVNFESMMQNQDLNKLWDSLHRLAGIVDMLNTQQNRTFE